MSWAKDSRCWSCQNCNEIDTYHGECRFHAPVVHDGPRWPSVDPQKDWCAEHPERSEKVSYMDELKYGDTPETLLRLATQQTTIEQLKMQKCASCVFDASCGNTTSQVVDCVDWTHR